ncbi:hypothetical protein JQN58_13210 [Aneurinibacillus sp. BA2021]|nr:hypothetical protein [Aneurinibacillus sp. BA2021]
MDNNQKDVERKLTEMYQRDTNAMVLVFAQWCVNHDIDPLALYQEAYPEQPVSAELQSMAALTVPKEEAGEIATDTLLAVLMMFDNERLAAVVQEKADAFEKK